MAGSEANHSGPDRYMACFTFNTLKNMHVSKKLVKLTELDMLQ